MQNRPSLEACEDFSFLIAHKKNKVTNSGVGIYVILTNSVFPLCSSLAMKYIPELLTQATTPLLTASAH